MEATHGRDVGRCRGGGDTGQLESRLAAHETGGEGSVRLKYKTLLPALNKHQDCLYSITGYRQGRARDLSLLFIIAPALCSAISSGGDGTTPHHVHISMQFYFEL